MKFRALNFDYESEASACSERRQLLGSDDSNVKQHLFFIQAGLYERSTTSSGDIRVIREKLIAKACALESSVSRCVHHGDSPTFFSNDGKLFDDMNERDKISLPIGNTSLTSATSGSSLSDELRGGGGLEKVQRVDLCVKQTCTLINKCTKGKAQQKQMLHIANQPWTETLRQSLHSPSNQWPVREIFAKPFVKQMSLLLLLQGHCLPLASSYSRELNLSRMGGSLAKLFLSKEAVLRILASITHNTLVLRIVDPPRHESLSQSQSQSIRYHICISDGSRLCNRLSFRFSSRHLITKATTPKVSFSTVNSSEIYSSKSSLVNALEQASASIPLFPPSNTTVSKRTRSYKRKNHLSNEEKVIRKKERKANKSGKDEDVKKRKHSHSMTELEEGTPKVLRSSRQLSKNLRKPISDEEVLPLPRACSSLTGEHIGRSDLPHMKLQTTQVSSRFQVNILSQESQQQVLNRSLTAGFTTQPHFENVPKNRCHQSGKFEAMNTAAAHPQAMRGKSFNSTRVFMFSESTQTVAHPTNKSGKSAMAQTLTHIFPLPQTANLRYQNVNAPPIRSNEQTKSTSQDFDLLQVSSGLPKYQVHGVKPKRTSKVKSPETKNVSEPVQLLCSESFLETWGECVTELASGRWVNVHSADNGEFEESQTTAVSNARKICLVDTPLVQSCRVDIEASGRCGLLVLLSSNFESVAETKQIVRDVAELVAIGRYVELFVFICCDTNIAPATTKHVIQMQCAVASVNGIPQTKVTFKTTIPRYLSMSLAHTILSRRKLLPNVKLLEDATIHGVADRQITERAQFLLSLLPSLCANGAIQCLLLSRHLLPNGSPYFELLLKNKKLQQKIAFATTSKEKGADVHPASMTHLALAAIINIGESLDSEQEESHEKGSVPAST